MDPEKDAQQLQRPLLPNRRLSRMAKVHLHRRRLLLLPPTLHPRRLPVLIAV
jgi:hypothetical protein